MQSKKAEYKYYTLIMLQYQWYRSHRCIAHHQNERACFKRSDDFRRRDTVMVITALVTTPTLRSACRGLLVTKQHTLRYRLGVPSIPPSPVSYPCSPARPDKLPSLQVTVRLPFDQPIFDVSIYSDVKQTSDVAHQIRRISFQTTTVARWSPHFCRKSAIHAHNGPVTSAGLQGHPETGAPPVQRCMKSVQWSLNPSRLGVSQAILGCS